MLDLILAGLHHLAVFTLVAVFASEFVLLRPGLEGRRIGQLLRHRRGLWCGGRHRHHRRHHPRDLRRLGLGSSYVFNWAFWAKMAAFAAMGGVSAIPTRAYIGWRKAYAADQSFNPPADEVRRMRGFLFIEVGLVALVPLFAAAMARGISAF